MFKGKEMMNALNENSDVKKKVLQEIIKWAECEMAEGMRSKKMPKEEPTALEIVIAGQKPKKNEDEEDDDEEENSF